MTLFSRFLADESGATATGASACRSVTGRPQAPTPDVELVSIDVMYHAGAVVT